MIFGFSAFEPILRDGMSITSVEDGMIGVISVGGGGTPQALINNAHDTNNTKIFFIFYPLELKDLASTHQVFELVLTCELGYILNRTL